MNSNSIYTPPPDCGLDLVYCDEFLLAVSKPAGLLSVPGRGEDKTDSLSSRVQAEFPDALVSHRLDRDTSGLLLFPRGADMHLPQHLAVCRRSQIHVDDREKIWPAVRYRR